MRRVVDVPPSLVERARAFLADPGEVAEPRHAATVVLLRDGASGPEVYLLRRAGTMAFAAGMHVFPGGSVDPRDASVHTAWSGPAPRTWGERLGCDESLARALVCAAVRETFEESGVLLAGRSADAVVADTTSADWERDRLALLDRSLSLAELLAARQLVLRSDLLRAWAHWITPEFEPRRFDTRFFVARAPQAQEPLHDDHETIASLWVRPSEALAQAERGELAMIAPTTKNVELLLPYATADDALSALGARGRPPTIRPKLRRDDDGGIEVVLPDDARFESLPEIDGRPREG
jgi:8-oxo-dGTP pyrophosphatase MutT (NUDIX family)